jgi:lycopene beta-cyclase
MGSEIVTEEDCFDPAYAELMDFSESTPAQILFLYVLPFAKNRALVEATLFDRCPMDAEMLEPLLGSLLKKRLGGRPFSVRRSEQGILPMGRTPAPPNAETGFVRAGLTAGGARPSTGYAFQRIQRWARVCAEAMGRGQAPLAHAADPFIPRFMDDLFLRVLRAHPGLAPDLFLSLFRKVDPMRIARFMSDRGRLSDYAAIITALPPLPFLRELSATMSVLVTAWLTSSTLNRCKVSRFLSVM